MEKKSCKWDQNALMNELTKGMELTKQLNTCLTNLNDPSSQLQFHLLQNILSSYQKALHILQPQTLPVLESFSSPDVSPRPHDDHQLDSTSRKRKVCSSKTWTNHVMIRTENGLESPGEDGYSWRKYGQKDILASKYPRSYYRCTYRNVHGCWATKQVQRSDQDPSLFEVTYKGKHTCNLHLSLPAQEMANHHHLEQEQQHISNEAFSNVRSSLRVDTHEHDEQMTPAFDPFSSFFADDNHLLGWVSSSEYSNNCEGNGFGEIISANTSVTNSPVVGCNLDFSIEPVRLGSFKFHDDQILDFTANNCNWN